MTTAKEKRDKLKEQLEDYISRVKRLQRDGQLSYSDIQNAKEYIDGVDLEVLKKTGLKYFNFRFFSASLMWLFVILSGYSLLLASWLIFAEGETFWYLAVPLAFAVLALPPCKVWKHFRQKEHALYSKIHNTSGTYKSPLPDLLLLRTLKLESREHNVEHLAELFRDSYIDSVRTNSKVALEATLVVAQKIIDELSHFECIDKEESFMIDTKWNMLTKDLK